MRPRPHLPRSCIRGRLHGNRPYPMETDALGAGSSPVGEERSLEGSPIGHGPDRGPSSGASFIRFSPGSSALPPAGGGTRGSRARLTESNLASLHRGNHDLHHDWRSGGEMANYFLWASGIVAERGNPAAAPDRGVADADSWAYPGGDAWGMDWPLVEMPSILGRPIHRVPMRRSAPRPPTVGTHPPRGDRPDALATRVVFRFRLYAPPGNTLSSACSIPLRRSSTGIRLHPGDHRTTPQRVTDSPNYLFQVRL